MSTSPAMIALRRIGVAPNETLSVTARPCACRTCAMTLPSRLPSVSIFDETTIASAAWARGPAARARTSPAAKDLNELNIGVLLVIADLSLGLAFQMPGARHVAASAMRQRPDRRKSGSNGSLTAQLAIADAVHQTLPRRQYFAR